MLNYDAAPPPAYPDQNVAKNLPPDRAVPAQTVPPSAQPGVPPTVPLVPGQPVPTYVGQHNNQLVNPCALGYHEPRTKFGMCGIITAVVCFPIGLLCLCADKETRCARCGLPLDR